MGLTGGPAANEGDVSVIAANKKAIEGSTPEFVAGYSGGGDRGRAGGRRGKRGGCKGECRLSRWKMRKMHQWKRWQMKKTGRWTQQ